MPVLMKIPGITGESSISQHTGWMTLLRFSWGAMRAARTQSGGTFGASRTFAAPQLRNVTVMRETDSATSALWGHMIGATEADIEIEWLRTGAGGEPEAYLAVTLRRSRVISIVAESSGQHPLETIGIIYEEIEFQVTDIDDSLSGVQDVLVYVIPTHR